MLVFYCFVCYYCLFYIGVTSSTMPTGHQGYIHILVGVGEDAIWCHVPNSGPVLWIGSFRQILKSSFLFPLLLSKVVFRKYFSYLLWQK